MKPATTSNYAKEKQLQAQRRRNNREAAKRSRARRQALTEALQKDLEFCREKFAAILKLAEKIKDGASDTKQVETTAGVIADVALVGTTRLETYKDGPQKPRRSKKDDDDEEEESEEQQDDDDDDNKEKEDEEIF